MTHRLSILVLLPVLLATAVLPVGVLGQNDPPAVGVDRDGPTQRELAIWRTPTYQKAFAMSLLAETDVEPTNDPAEIRAMTEALDLVAVPDLDGAISRLEEARDARSGASIDFMLGNLLYLQGRLDESAEALAQAVGRYPNFRRAWVRLGDVEARRGEVDAALRALVKAHTLGANDATTLGLLGWAHASKGNWISAESAYRTALMLAPTMDDWRIGLADALLRQERAEEAVAIFRPMVERNPADARLWWSLAQAELLAGRIEAAIQGLEMAVALGETPDRRALALLGDLYLEQDVPALALRAHLDAFRSDDSADLTAACTAMARLLERGDHAEVARTLESLQEEDLGKLDRESRTRLERIRARTNLFTSSGEEEAATLRMGVERDPLDGNAMILLGRHHATRPGEFEEAEFWFERAEALEDHRVEAMVAHAELLVEVAQYDRAIGLLKAAQALQPRPVVATYLAEIEAFNRNR
ncbi:MAG: tetratricopeptide repeat protein [Planctomycetota bacterium]|nr:tetratricopeptide repeat protein [Planctomycetota bacterium]